MSTPPKPPLTCKGELRCAKDGSPLVFWMVVLLYQFVATDSLGNWRLTKDTVRIIKAKTA